MPEPTLPKQSQRMSADDVTACVGCGKQAAHSLFFYVIDVQQAAVDMNAAQRQFGLEQMLGGNAAIAAAMGDRNVIRRWPYGTGRAQVCNDCMLTVTLADLMGSMESD